MLIIIPPLLHTRLSITAPRGVQGNSVTNLKFFIQSIEKVKILGSLEILNNLLFQFTILTLIHDCGLRLPVGASEKVAAGTLTGEVASTLVGMVACATS
jgi:hypothetical protein